MCQCLGSCSCEGIPFEPQTAVNVNQIESIVVNGDNTITLILTDATEVTSIDAVTVNQTIQAGNVRNTNAAPTLVGGELLPANTLAAEDLAWLEFEGILVPDTANPFTITVGPTVVFTKVIPDETVSNLRVQGRLILSTKSTGGLYVTGQITLSFVDSPNVDTVLQLKEIATAQDITTNCTISLLQSGSSSFNFSTLNYLKHI